MLTPRTALLLAVTCFMGAASAGEGPRIVLDPGHGGLQEGAVSATGYFEKNLALQVAERVKTELELLLHAHVQLTREHDVLLALADRVALANRFKPDLFVSLHANSMPTRKLRERTEGIETFFLSPHASGDEAGKTAARENAEGPHAGAPSAHDTLAFILADLARSEAHTDSSRLAYAVHQAIIRATHAVDRGVQQAPFYVLTGVEAPAVLVEVGFISHGAEGKRLREAGYQQQMARGIAQGVQAFLRQLDARERHPSPPPTSTPTAVAP